MDGCGTEWETVCGPREPDSRPHSRATKGIWIIQVLLFYLLTLCNGHLPQLDSTFWQPRPQLCRPCCIQPTASAFAVYYRADCTSRWRPNRAHTVDGKWKWRGFKKMELASCQENYILRHSSINIHIHVLVSLDGRREVLIMLMLSNDP